jgi:hypothetical protein
MRKAGKQAKTKPKQKENKLDLPPPSNMPQHGDFDSVSQKWYCRYWMDLNEWYDVHDYAPPSLQKAGNEEEGTASQDGSEDQD